MLFDSSRLSIIRLFTATMADEKGLSDALSWVLTRLLRRPRTRRRCVHEGPKGLKMSIWTDSTPMNEPFGNTESWIKSIVA